MDVPQLVCDRSLKQILEEKDKPLAAKQAKKEESKRFLSDADYQQVLNLLFSKDPLEQEITKQLNFETLKKEVTEFVTKVDSTQARNKKEQFTEDYVTSVHENAIKLLHLYLGRSYTKIPEKSVTMTALSLIHLMDISGKELFMHKFIKNELSGHSVKLFDTTSLVIVTALNSYTNIKMHSGFRNPEKKEDLKRLVEVLLTNYERILQEPYLAKLVKLKVK